MSDEKLDEAERYYHEQLRFLQESYHRQAEPIIKKLLEIRNLRPQRILIRAEDVQIPLPTDDRIAQIARAFGVTG